MTDTKTASVPALIIRRTFNAPRARVFDAFTDATLFRSWLCPPGNSVKDLQLDARRGGSYRIVFVSDEGEVMNVRGVFSEVRKPERLAYTWRWEEDSAADEFDTFITVDFVEHGAQTEMIFKHEGFASEESRGRHEQGWTATFGLLEKLF
jgi:uncharacterized protein YndB with AHSA1/START domain